MTISAKIIADSVSPRSVRLTTMQLRYPKFIHGEFMTHRVFSRNASSSCAIPVSRLIQDVIEDPAMPVFWGKNQSGMQAREELAPGVREQAMSEWLTARDLAVESARQMAVLGAHKQIVNRVIEPWRHINVIVTSTEWMNFFALRCHVNAQPEMKALADAMLAAYTASTPVGLLPNEWHLPYVEHHELTAMGPIQTHLCGADGIGAWTDRMRDKIAIKLSVARCARVSYLTHAGTAPTVAEDLALYDRLIAMRPSHASPAEHQATPDGRRDLGGTAGHWLHREEWGNFYGWRQYRKMLPNEAVYAR